MKLFDDATYTYHWTLWGLGGFGEGYWPVLWEDAEATDAHEWELGD